jgi:hypothetical protein
LCQPGIASIIDEVNERGKKIVFFEKRKGMMRKAFDETLIFYFLYLYSLGQPGLYCASRQGRVEIVISFIIAGANVNYQIKNHGGTALHGTLFYYFIFNILFGLTYRSFFGFLIPSSSQFWKPPRGRRCAAFGWC